jgi:8-oxo-dGTP diphosphatase
MVSAIISAMASSERNSVTPAALLILEKDDKVLLLRRCNTSFQDGQYTVPSGKVDPAESPLKAAIREAEEEVKITVRPEDVRFEQVLYRPIYNSSGTGFDPAQGEWVDFFFSTRVWDREPIIGEPEKCDEIGWFPLHDIPENTFPVVAEFLRTYGNHKPYKEAGYDKE